MKLQHPLLHKTFGLLASFAIRQWSRTIDWKAVYFDPTVDTVHPRHQGRYVYATWHEHMLMPIALRGSRRMVALASNHSDGELVSRAMGHLGWRIARGSSTRGGTAALLRLLRDEDRHPNLTPDGPRGPRRKLSSGAIFLASRLELPLVCVGYGYDRPWRLRSWDCFAIPRPGTRARAVFGPPLRLPPDLDRAGLESYRAWFERLLNWLTQEAEGWAESGRRRPGEMSMLRAEARWAMMARRHPVPAFTLPKQLVNDWAVLTAVARAA
jgi:lysophospholipid acyltransferase (LPLAT)-like uncharacterized protein